MLEAVLFLFSSLPLDIDYIKIKSDAEAETELRDANTRKTYHYRVSTMDFNGSYHIGCDGEE